MIGPTVTRQRAARLKVVTLAAFASIAFAGACDDDAFGGGPDGDGTGGDGPGGDGTGALGGDGGFGSQGATSERGGGENAGGGDAEGGSGARCGADDLDPDAPAGGTRSSDCSYCSPDEPAAFGRPSCVDCVCAAGENALPPCATNSECTTPICNPGFANCAQQEGHCPDALADASCAPTFEQSHRVSGAAGQTRAAFLPDGSYVVAGHSLDEFDFDPGPAEDLRGATETAFVSKFDSDGTYQWTRTIDNAVASALAVDASGDIVVAGSLHGEADLDPGPEVELARCLPDLAAPFVVKLNADGELIHARCFETDRTNVSALATDEQSSVYLTLRVDSTIDLDPGPAIDEYTPPPFRAEAEVNLLVKLDASGNYVAGSALDGGCNVDIVDAVVGSDQLWLVGYLRSQCGFAPPESSMEAWISTFDLEGNLVKQRRFSGAPYSWAFGVAADSDGSIHIVGNAVGGVDPDLDLAEGGIALPLTDQWNPSAFIVSYAPDGSLLSARLLPQLDATGGIAVAPGHDLLVASRSRTDARLLPATLVRLRSDALPAWSLATKPDVLPRRVAANGTHFLVVSDHEDFAPPAQDNPSLGGSFVTRFAF